MLVLMLLWTFSLPSVDKSSGALSPTFNFNLLSSSTIFITYTLLFPAVFMQWHRSDMLLPSSFIVIEILLVKTYRQSTPTSSLLQTLTRVAQHYSLISFRPQFQQISSSAHSSNGPYDPLSP